MKPLFVLRSPLRYVRSAVGNVYSAVRNVHTALRNIKQKQVLFKITTAIVNTLRQLLLHIHYHYPHTITMLILRYLISDRRCNSSHLTTQQHYFVTLSVIFSCQTSAVIGLNPALYNDKVNQCTEVNAL